MTSWKKSYLRTKLEDRTRPLRLYFVTIVVYRKEAKVSLRMQEACLVAIQKAQIGTAAPA